MEPIYVWRLSMDSLPHFITLAVFLVIAAAGYFFIRYKYPDEEFFSLLIFLWFMLLFVAFSISVLIRLAFGAVL